MMHRGTMTAVTTPPRSLLRGTGRRGLEEKDVVANTNSSSVGVEATTAAKKAPKDKDTQNKLALQTIKDHIETKKNNSTNIVKNEEEEEKESPKVEKEKAEDEEEEEEGVNMKVNLKVDLEEEETDEQPKIKDHGTETNKEAEDEDKVLVKEDLKWEMMLL
jgi:hypothetical protein